MVPFAAAISAPLTVLATALERLSRLPLGDPRWPGTPQPRSCVACGRPLDDGDPFLRYRGEYFHAEPCLEQVLPAMLRAHQGLTPPTRGAQGDRSP